MGCITKLLESGDKRVNDHNLSPYVEGGGVYKDYEYLMVINHSGHRCGYVAISAFDLLYQIEHCNDIDIEMHGGCTFFEKQMTKSTCSDKWIGFDCGHAYDRRDVQALKLCDPKMGVYYEDWEIKYPPYSYQVIRTKDYVETECKSIIDQLCGGVN